MVRRFFKHICSSQRMVRRLFPAAALASIEQAVKAVEAEQAAEVRVVIEAALHPLAVLCGHSARDRAVELFSELRIWDTQHNNGVLLYLLLAERNIELVVDRGLSSRVNQESWDRICNGIEADFKGGAYAAGIIRGLEEIGKLLGQHFTTSKNPTNELSDRPLILT